MKLDNTEWGQPGQGGVPYQVSGQVTWWAKTERAIVRCRAALHRLLCKKLTYVMASHHQVFARPWYSGQQPTYITTTSYTSYNTLLTAPGHPAALPITPPPCLLSASCCKRSAELARRQNTKQTRRLQSNRTAHDRGAPVQIRRTCDESQRG